MQVRVSGLEQLASGEALVFEFERAGERRQGFVLRRDDDWFAYHNRCPHLGVDLDRGEGRFYSSLTRMIFCSSHGALFEVSSGDCVAGPCVGRSLERFELAREGDVGVVTISDVDPDPRW